MGPGVKVSNWNSTRNLKKCAYCPTCQHTSRDEKSMSTLLSKRNPGPWWAWRISSCWRTALEGITPRYLTPRSGGWRCAWAVWRRDFWSAREPFWFSLLCNIWVWSFACSFYTCIKYHIWHITGRDSTDNVRELAKNVFWNVILAWSTLHCPLIAFSTFIST